MPDREPITEENRPWRLRGYGTDKKIRHQSTERGDRALDRAYAELEADPQVDRITVEQSW